MGFRQEAEQSSPSVWQAASTLSYCRPLAELHNLEDLPEHCVIEKLSWRKHVKAGSLRLAARVAVVRFSAWQGLY